jgi:hypothetical protein
MEFYNTYAEGRVFDPYDCSKQPTSGSSGNLTKYCLQARFYSCAVKTHCPFTKLGGNCTLGGQKKMAGFFPCAENAAGSHSDFADAVPCAKKNGLDLTAIETCFDPTNVAYNSPAMQIIDLVSNATEKAVPQVKYFPDVRVNGKQLSDVSAAGLIKAVCTDYKGVQPTACN